MLSGYLGCNVGLQRSHGRGADLTRWLDVTDLVGRPASTLDLGLSLDERARSSVEWLQWWRQITHVEG